MGKLSAEDLKAFEAEIRLGLDIHEAAEWRITDLPPAPASGVAHLFVCIPGILDYVSCGASLYFDSISYNAYVAERNKPLVTIPRRIMSKYTAADILWCAECLTTGHELARMADPKNVAALFGVEVP